MFELCRGFACQACNIFKRLKLGIGEVVPDNAAYLTLADLLFADVHTQARIHVRVYTFIFRKRLLNAT